jgi:hypothetical protein
MLDARWWFDLLRPGSIASIVERPHHRWLAITFA